MKSNSFFDSCPAARPLSTLTGRNMTFTCSPLRFHGRRQPVPTARSAWTNGPRSQAPSRAGRADCAGSAGRRPMLAARPLPLRPRRRRSAGAAAGGRPAPRLQWEGLRSCAPLLLQLPRVARFEKRLVILGEAGLDLTPALEFGV